MIIIIASVMSHVDHCNAILAGHPSPPQTSSSKYHVRSSGLFCSPWNSLPDYLRDPPHSFDSFRRELKTFLFSFY